MRYLLVAVGSWGQQHELFLWQSSCRGFCCCCVTKCGEDHRCPSRDSVIAGEGNLALPHHWAERLLYLHLSKSAHPERSL